ncbi:MAG: hypothetical protein AB8G23_19130 [Myxococcota bacterium]
MKRLPLTRAPKSIGTILFASFVFIVFSGCSTTHFIRVDPEQALQLEPNEGLLAFHVDSDLALNRLVLTNLIIREPIPAGRRFWIARIRAGSYQWRKVAVAQTNFKGDYRISRSAYQRREELDFKIEAGKINYAGELVVRKGRAAGSSSWISVRIRNHAGQAIRTLEREAPQLLDQYPVHTSANTTDRFFEFYAAERKRIADQEQPSPSEAKSMEAPR